MSDLVAFLRARLDDDERLARACWTQSWEKAEGPNVFVMSSEGLVAQTTDFSATPHIVRHDPARGLADVAAKRGIVDVHVGRGECTRCEWFSGELYPCDTLKLLGSVYAGHQDYREEWKP